MKIVVITGSPRKNGTSFELTQRFMEGAKAAGHEVERFDAADLKLHPCRACNYCKKTEEQCVQKDDMEQIRPAVKGADAIVFVTPVYYYGVCSQLKMVIDRFYAFNESLLNSGKKVAVIATAGGDEEWTMDAVKSNFHLMCRYLGLEICGEVYATGIYEKADFEGTDYLGQAYRLGLEMKK